jgi:hypothetical protein
MEERIRFIEHKGKKILLVDLSHAKVPEVLLLQDLARNTIAQHRGESLLTLGDFTDAEIDRAVATKIKEVMTLDRPYVRKTAWVGTESIPHAFLENFEHFSQRKIIVCKTREEAMERLVED